MGCPISRRPRRIYRVARTGAHVSGYDVVVLGIRPRRRRYQSSCERRLVSTTTFNLERSRLPHAVRHRSARRHKFILGPLGQPLGSSVPRVDSLLHARPPPAEPSLPTPPHCCALRDRWMVTVGYCRGEFRHDSSTGLRYDLARRLPSGELAKVVYVADASGAILPDEEPSDRVAFSEIEQVFVTDAQQ
jgi:hypothetical protein